ncbi:hypothetical protein LV476_11140 [Guyparkeria hydrothermalis]|uniref:hypothetical protein n=1 Tax=Guyparkeria hydrothermalis TaxID=923 RepID=UPI00201FEE9F|nr:hypothetical protein [Guyparkeria hydrothermalis]MCL7745490.1 hypothetical protein [Guyparkeria hydrothermalis]
MAALGPAGAAFTPSSHMCDTSGRAGFDRLRQKKFYDLKNRNALFLLLYNDIHTQ